ncbi:unc-15 [Cordylochernes scorpioides]|uniref:Paramyosin n=1 Tax=Cordylochernes scorpioides TaxID=51811 RepID=A0ABY6KEU1_9ARAC|nr:unc-15 [Cordylochernes scorpioides]
MSASSVVVSDPLINDGGPKSPSPDRDSAISSPSAPPSPSGLVPEDLGETRIQLSDTTRRLQEVETELRRVEAEREEASQAYREAEALRRQEEAKCQRLGAELAQQRHEFEVRLVQKDEEYETLRKQTQIELDQMSQRVADAEAKVKTEVARIKKKMQLTITELEMSLDVSNKKIIDLQKIVKTQSLQITEIQARYEEVQIQIQQTTDQLVVSQRRCQGLVGEIEELRAALEQAARGKRAAEQHAEETNAKLTESNNQISVLVASRTKLEADVTVLKHDCEETIKELRICDERLQRVLVELKTARDHLTEERERSAKLDVVKKSLEVEVRNLQIRIEEVEVSALAGTKRAITKLESRVRDLEIEIDEERRRHAETLKVSRKKELRIKELLTQIEEDQCTIAVLNDSVEKLAEKMKMYKRQLNEQEGVSQQNLSRVRRFQRELEAAEERADCAESSLSMIRAKHRTWVTTSSSTSHQGVMISHEETTAHTGF